MPTGSAEFQHFILRFNKQAKILSCPRIVPNNKGKKSRSTQEWVQGHYVMDFMNLHNGHVGFGTMVKKL